MLKTKRQQTNSGRLVRIGIATICSAIMATAIPSRSHALTINAIFDSSVTGASNAAAIESAFNTAAAAYTGAFVNPITVNIQVGWGEDGGTPLSSNNAGASNTGINCCWSYSQITTALAPFISLPAASPASGDWFGMPYAESRALGLAPAKSSITDGSVGISSRLKYTFSGAVAAGTYSAVGVFEHEIAEVLGRNSTIYSDGQDGFWDQPFDLLRYSSPGNPDIYSPTAASYVSLDGGVTSLGAGNPPSNGGDANDWLGSKYNGVNDVQNSGLSTGATVLSPADLAILAALGWNGTPQTQTILTTYIGSLGHLATVPEPSAAFLMATGFAGLVLIRRRVVAQNPR